jgi:hypothetical protein
MRVDRQIAALRGDIASQRRAQAKFDAAKLDWLVQPDVAALSDELNEFGCGKPLGELPALQHLVTRLADARHLIDDWQRTFVAELDGNRLGHVPFKHNYSAGFATVRLFESGRASLSLLVYEEMAESALPQAAAFSDREQVEIVLAGRADVLLHRFGTDQAMPETVRKVLRAGSVINLIGRDDSRHIHNVTGSLLVLQLSRAAVDPQPVREINLADGSLLHQASGAKRESQLLMAMAVLTEMGRTDAAPRLAQMADEGPSHLRWEAVRHTLALDPVLGFGLLGEIAMNGQDELAVPARSLRDQLARAHPQLLQSEAEECPA